MKLLAIDTSANLCAAAVYDSENEKILCEKTQDIGRGHAEVLMGLIEECLTSSNLAYNDLDRIAVTIGPGSFTGVRVGMSVAKGLALGLALPVVGISTLDALTHLAREQGHEEPLASLIDARRDQAYCKIEDKDPFVATYQELAEKLGTFNGSICGSGASALLEQSGLNLLVVHSEAAAPISTIARMAGALPDSDGPIEPLYLRSADAKVQTASTILRERA